jgi:hypothetical protein
MMYLRPCWSSSGFLKHCAHGCGRAQSIELPLRIYTIGHSTRTIAEFTEMLQAHAVKRLVDVRTVPRSRHNPQYNREELSAALERDHLGYAYMPGLGGFRHPRKDALTNLGWRNLSFRGYADYMQTPNLQGNCKISSRWPAWNRSRLCVPRLSHGDAIAP